LLFNLGESELSGNARNSLHKIVEVIRDTPYMINVVGHTDNIPMRSTRFKSNWELSVARASTVARYLIEEIGMDPSQFVVSGYSSYRPIEPNITSENRAKNRRVEIIISKRLPDPLPATADNLK
jgi:chemotaxis protein MotB